MSSDNNMLADLGPATNHLVRAVLAVWPEHSKYLRKSFQARNATTTALAERTAALIETLVDGDFTATVEGYRWMCDMVMAEELEFRRHGRYRHSTFAAVNDAVYQNRAEMSLYMDGLLASSVLWSQHAQTTAFYVERFLAGNPDGFRHLEVGPGHGLLAYYAASDPRCATLTGWDISPVSLEMTRHALDKIGVERAVTLETRDITNSLGEQLFDSIVISEVCEHLEDPVAALASLRTVLADGGRLYVNVPCNAPAVDHIYLLRSPSEATDMVQRAGFSVVESEHVPVAGYSLGKAQRRKASISCALTAVKV